MKLLFLLRASACYCVCAVPWSWLQAGETNDAIPPLRPPRAELPPSFWEQHGSALVGAGILLGLIFVVAIWFLTRPKPPVLIPPAVVARQALQSLAAAPETGAVLSQASQILRHYVTAAFALPPGEMTTTDFCQALAAHRAVGPELTAALADFLHRSDKRKFAPGTTLPPLEAVAETLSLIERCEKRLHLRTQNRSHSPGLP